jgi:hypothetical protein
MTIPPRGVAIFSGLVLGAIGVYGLRLDRGGAALPDFLIATWLPPIVLWPVTTMICALDPEVPRSVKGQFTQLWPMYVGLALLALPAGYWWDYGARIGMLDDYARTLQAALMILHAVVFLGGGALLTLHPKSRPAATQLWLGYAVLLPCWIMGASL